MTRRDRMVITIVVCAALLGALWFLVLGPKRSEAGKLASQLSQQRSRLATARADVAASRAAQGSYTSNYAAVAQLGKAVPADDDVPSLVYQLNSTATSTGVDFQSIKLAPAGSSNSGAAAATATATPGAGGAQSPGAAPGAGGARPAGSGATPVANSTPAAASQTASASLPPGAAVGPAGFATMPFSFQFNGSFFRLADFFGQLQHYIASGTGGVSVSGRLLMINGISLTFGPRGFPHMKAAVAATAYLLPQAQGLTNGATPTAPPAGRVQPVSTPGGGGSTAPATVSGPSP